MGLRHRSIRLRVGILIAVPVLCLIIVYAVAATLSLGNALTQTRAKSVQADLAGPISNFQQQLAFERGLAVLSVATRADPVIAGKLAAQQAVTTKALAQLETVGRSRAVTSIATGAERAALGALVSQRTSLDALRRDVASGGITMRAALTGYDTIIDAGTSALDAICDAQGNVTIVARSLDILTLDRADQAAIAETNLLAGDITQGAFPDADRTTIASLAGSRQQLAASALPDASRAFRAQFTTYVTPPVTAAMLTAESTVTSTFWRHGPPPPSVTAARTAFAAYSVSLGKALSGATSALQDELDQQARTVQLQLWLAGGFGLLAVLGSVVLSVVLGRGLVRQLRKLRGSALELATDSLPSVISRARAGETVDLADFAPPAEVPTRDELEQLQQALGAVQQAAVAAAVEEARLRRGVSDVFRNLAGRSQSLLHRQLTLLDGMERRATEPDELADLFRLDHLTTRMRRHAEGLIILSGDSPARGWRQPVLLIDVLRAAVAEVEDYTRIRVQCRTGASVAGHAVADIVHLLAELAENATVFSPPNTPVRMQGDRVGRGLSIEIEDRGLGISQARLHEINARLASPPQFDLSSTDRLGLLITSQLAQRHDVKVTLQPSVYGGTTAIVLIPAALIVDVDAIDRGPANADAPNNLPQLSRLSRRQAALAASNGRQSPADETEDRARSGGFVVTRLTPRAEPTATASPVSGSDTAAPVTTSAEPADSGLPVRVRQASLAPQLRDSLPTRRPSAVAPNTPGPAGADAADAAASPEAARSTVSALQRGWQLGRAKSQPEPAQQAEQADAEPADGAGHPVDND